MPHRIRKELMEMRGNVYWDLFKWLVGGGVLIFGGGISTIAMHYVIGYCAMGIGALLIVVGFFRRRGPAVPIAHTNVELFIGGLELYGNEVEPALLCPIVTVRNLGDSTLLRKWEARIVIGASAHDAVFLPDETEMRGGTRVPFLPRLVNTAMPSGFEVAGRLKFRLPGVSYGALNKMFADGKTPISVRVSAQDATGKQFQGERDVRQMMAEQHVKTGPDPRFV